MTCAFCDTDPETVSRNMDEVIAKYGHTVIGVFDGEPAPFAYTVGRWEVGKAELAITGMPGPQSTVLLNLFAKHFDDAGRDPVDGELVMDVTNMPAKIAKVGSIAQHDFMMQAINRHHDGGNAYQVLWPDTVGIFPDEPGFNARAFHEFIMGATDCDWKGGERE